MRKRKKGKKKKGSASVRHSISYHKSHPVSSPPPSFVPLRTPGPQTGSRTRPRTHGRLIRSHSAVRPGRSLGKGEGTLSVQPDWPSSHQQTDVVSTSQGGWRPHVSSGGIEVTVPSTKMDSAFEDVSERESSAVCLNFKNTESASSISPMTGLKKNHKNNHFKTLN